MRETIEEIIKLCEYEHVDPMHLFTNLLTRIKKVGTREACRELEALSNLESRRALFIKQLKIKDWVKREIGHYRYTFTDIDHLASYKNRLMLIEYKYINPKADIGNLLTTGQWITYRYLNRLKQVHIHVEM